MSASFPRRYGTAHDEECAEYQLKVIEIFVDQLLHALPGRLPENDFSVVLADPHWETVDFVPLAASATICNVRPNGRGHESLARASKACAIQFRCWTMCRISITSLVLSA